MRGGRRKGGGCRALVACGVALVLWSMAPAQAGVVLRFETRRLDGAGVPVQRGTTRIQGKWLRMDLDAEDGEGPASSIVFDGERRVLARVDHRDETVVELSLSQLKAMMREVSAQLEKGRQEMEEQEPTLPEDQRRRREGVLERGSGSESGQEGGEAGRPRLEVRRTERRERLDGRSCVVVELLRAEEVVREACVVEWQLVGLEPTAFAVFGELGAFFDEMMKGITGVGEDPLAGNPFLALDQLDGLPLLVRSFEEGERRQETTLSLTEIRPLDPEELKPPADYRRVDWRSAAQPQE